MPRRRSISLPSGRTIHTAFTDASDGDFCVALPDDELASRRELVAPGPWTWLDQVHGASVVQVGRPGEFAGAEADAAVTDVPGAVLAVHTADCAGVLMWSAGSGCAVVGAAHAGWRGLELGVLEATVDTMAAAGASELHWQLGPCISAAAYEFGDAELQRLAVRYGPQLVSVTAQGRPALDLRAGVRAAMGALGATEAPDGDDVCTASGPGYFSWRARRDRCRQASVIWIGESS